MINLLSCLKTTRQKFKTCNQDSVSIRKYFHSNSNSSYLWPEYIFHSIKHSNTFAFNVGKNSYQIHVPTRTWEEIIFVTGTAAVVGVRKFLYAWPGGLYISIWVFLKRNKTKFYSSGWERKETSELHWIEMILMANRWQIISDCIESVQNSK